MRVQNNNTQQNFGLNCTADTGFARKIVKNGWQDIVEDIFQRAKTSFPEDTRTIHFEENGIRVFTGKKQNFYKGLELGNTVKNAINVINSEIVKTFEGKKKFDALPSHVESLNKQYGTAIKFDPEGFEERVKNEPEILFEHLTNLAQALSETPNSKKYRVSLCNKDAACNTCSLIIQKGKQTTRESLFFEKKIPKGKLKEMLNDMIKYAEEKAAEAKTTKAAATRATNKKKTFNNNVSAFLSAVNGQ